MSINEALENLVPFAEAVLELKQKSDELSNIERSIASRRAELDNLVKKQEIAVAGARDAEAQAAAAREQAIASRKGIEEANAERARILAQAKADAQRDYDAQLRSKQSVLDEVTSKTAKEMETLSRTKKLVESAQARLVEVENQIQQLRRQFA